jgi:hypothetical protein
MKRSLADSSKKNLAKSLASWTLSLALGSALLLRSGSAAADDAKCTIAVKGDSPTARACGKGGRKEARKVMKDMVTAANKGGGKFTCEGCHKDLDSYELTKGAVEGYKKLQAASGVK